MTVNFLLIFLLHAEDDLGWDDAFIRILEVQIWVQAKRSGVFEQMGGDFFVVNKVLHVRPRLIHSQESETVEDTRVDFLSPISNDADYYLSTCHDETRVVQDYG